jgi:hypothetical protein
MTTAETAIITAITAEINGIQTHRNNRSYPLVTAVAVVRGNCTAQNTAIIQNAQSVESTP